jgi:hypothetical protein
MIACTHTHSGPATIYLRDCGEVDEAWLTLLRRRLVEVTEAARSNLRAVRLSAGRGYFAEGVRNRRVPDGVMDPELGVLRIQDERGQMMAVLLNYACHPTSVHYDNRLISADYPGYVMEAVQRETGAVALFATGAVGDVGPSTERGFPTAEALGSALAAEALRVLDGITVEDRRGIAVATETLNLPLEALPSIEEMEQIVAESRRLLMEAQAASEPLRAKICRAMLGWSEATLVAQSADYPKGLRKLREGRAPKSVSTQVQVICLGDLALVGVPGELFVELGLAIKRDAGARQVFVCGYANDDVGYLPTRQAYAQGGYEVREAFKYYGYPAALAPEAGEQMVEAAVRLIRRCLGD